MVNAIHPFLQKDSLDNWNTIPPVPAGMLPRVNCHKFILFIIKQISWDEMVADTSIQEKADPAFDFTFRKKAQGISPKEFTYIDDLDSLYNFTKKECELGRVYVGQILDAQTNELAHSFILERTSDGAFTCFDKLGFKHYPFSVHELGTLLDFINKDGEKPYVKQKWRFVHITV